ncbi:MAG: ASKHA domain-containing protein [Chloroflexota bacterium]
MRRGLLSALPLERFCQVGSATGTGARMALVSRRVRRLAIDVARRVRYVELMAASEFANGCGQALYLL